MIPHGLGDYFLILTKTAHADVSHRPSWTHLCADKQQPLYCSAYLPHMRMLTQRLVAHPVPPEVAEGRSVFGCVESIQSWMPFGRDAGEFGSQAVARAYLGCANGRSIYADQMLHASKHNECRCKHVAHGTLQVCIVIVEQCRCCVDQIVCHLMHGRHCGHNHILFGLVPPACQCRRGTQLYCTHDCESRYTTHADAGMYCWDRATTRSSCC